MKNYRYVNTKMGSFNHFRYSNGNCYPVCAVPHGMNFYTIQNDSSKNEIGSPHWFYSPLSKSFEGIRLTHMPSPWLGDYGRLLIYGQRDELYSSGVYWSSFDNNKAVIEPAYMSVYVDRDRYQMELTPTDKCAAVKFKFRDEGGINRVVFAGDGCTYEFDEKNSTLFITTVQCDQKSCYKPDDPRRIKEHIVIKLTVPCTFEAAENKISLGVSECEFEIKLATSYISREQALLNFEREISTKSFDEIRAETTAEWEEYLSRIEIEDPDEEKKATFYSCMYRAFLWPRRFYEIDANGKPMHVNTATGEKTEGYLYTDNGFWDTYRTLYPYLSLVDTKLYRDMTEGFYNYYVDTGWLPKWVCPYNLGCMPGMLVEATMGDAIVKDIVDRDLAEKIFEAMLKDGEVESNVHGEGRVALGAYRKYGYVPYTVAKESVNETLDNSLGDFAIAMAAQKLGYSDIAERYFEYAKNYQKLFDPETGFIRGKDENGCFRDENFNPFAWGRDYTEGSAWQNAFGVYHDMIGLNELYGGKLADKIDELMTAPEIYFVGGYNRTIHEMAELVQGRYGQCAISNQPSFHIPYIYSEIGLPEKTAYHTTRLAELYNSGIEGYPGDEDNGSASAWYLLSAMGLYQVAPSRPDFATSLPYFAKMRVKLANGKILEINRDEYDLSQMSGKVSYFDVMNGGNLADIVKNK